MYLYLILPWYSNQMTHCQAADSLYGKNTRIEFGEFNL